MLRFSPGSSFLYQPDGAVLRSHEAVRTIARLATAHGAEVREATASSTNRASVAIVAAGAWSGSILGRAGIPLTLRPTLEQSTYFDADAADLPTVIDWDEAPEQPPSERARDHDPGRVHICPAPSSIRTRGRSSPTRRASFRSSTGWGGGSCPVPDPSAPRRASTRGRPTRTSSSIGSDRSWWHPRAAATASSSHRSSARCWRISSRVKRPRSPWNGSEPIGRPSGLPPKAGRLVLGERLPGRASRISCRCRRSWWRRRRRCCWRWCPGP